MSNSERETMEIVLERSKTTVVLYEYITGRDKRYIQRAYMEQANISSKMNKKENSNTVEIGGVSGTVNEEMENRAIESVVKEVRRASEGEEKAETITEKKAVREFVLDLPVDDYEELVAAINKITEPKKA